MEDGALRSVGSSVLAPALARAALINPYFTLLLGTAPPDGTAAREWHETARLYDTADPRQAARPVSTVRERVGGEPRVAASLFFQGYAARLFSPVLATLAGARLVPDLSAGVLRWRQADGQPFQLWLPVLRGWTARSSADLVQCAYDTVVDGHLAPLAAVLRQVVPLSEHVLWGNAASALAGSARTLSPERDENPGSPYVLARLLLDRGPLRGRGTWEEHSGSAPPSFRRRSCCLYYRLPGGGTCGDCVLTAPRRSRP